LFGLIVLRDFIVAYMAGLWFAIPWIWFTTKDPVYLAYIVVVNILFVVAMVPDLKQYQRARKLGNVDLSTVMDMTPMGRGMKRMMDRMHLNKN
jgi:hypothetical protein